MVAEQNAEVLEEKSFFNIIIHSFFVIPFLIAVFCVLLFTAMHLLTRENRTAYDYLNDVKAGGSTKRWQGAFELSKILANPKLIPNDGRFSSELIHIFKASSNDDNRVRQYLALAMGRTERPEFATPLTEALKDEKEENLPAIIYALGMLKDKNTLSTLYPYLDHANPRIRSIAVVAVGNIGDSRASSQLQKKLFDLEPNVQWGAALSLAQLGNGAGKDIVAKLLDRGYLSKFSEVDQAEQNYLMIQAIQAAAAIHDPQLLEQVKKLSTTDQNMNVRSIALQKVSTK